MKCEGQCISRMLFFHLTALPSTHQPGKYNHCPDNSLTSGLLKWGYCELAQVKVKTVCAQDKTKVPGSFDSACSHPQSRRQNTGRKERESRAMGEPLIYNKAGAEYSTTTTPETCGNHVEPASSQIFYAKALKLPASKKRTGLSQAENAVRSLQCNLPLLNAIPFVESPVKGKQGMSANSPTQGWPRMHRSCLFKTEAVQRKATWWAVGKWNKQMGVIWSPCPVHLGSCKHQIFGEKLSRVMAVFLLPSAVQQEKGVPLLQYWLALSKLEKDQHPHQSSRWERPGERHDWDSAPCNCSGIPKVGSRGANVPGHQDQAGGGKIPPSPPPPASCPEIVPCQVALILPSERWGKAFPYHSKGQQFFPSGLLLCLKKKAEKEEVGKSSHSGCNLSHHQNVSLPTHLPSLSLKKKKKQRRGGQPPEQHGKTLRVLWANPSWSKDCPFSSTAFFF